MKVVLQADGRTASGGTPLIMHNERLADPLDSLQQALSEITGKRKKTLEDHAEMAYREFLGGLYTNPVLEWPLNGTDKSKPVIPAWNVLRCLQDGGKRHKRGVDVPKGVHPAGEFAEFIYDGPSDPVELWADGAFSLRKAVGIQRARMMRTRPIFIDWQLKLPVEVDMDIFDVSVLEKIWKDAGKYSGLGDMRPVYGRFLGTVKKEEK